MHCIKWLLVEWENSNEHHERPQYGVVHVRSLLNPSSDLHTGKLVLIADGSGNMQRAKVVMSSDDRRFLAQQLLAMEEHSRMSALDHQNVSGPSGIVHRPGDTKTNILSPSGSSWSRGNDMRSDSDSESSHQSYNIKRENARHYSLPASRSISNNLAQFNHTGGSLGRRTNNESVNRNKQRQYVQRTIYKSQTQRSSTPFSREANKSIAMTYDQGTQTGPRFSQIGVRTLPRIEEKVAMLEQVIDDMEEKFSILEATIESWSAGAEQTEPDSPEAAIDMSLRELQINTCHNEQLIKLAPIKKRELTHEENSENEEVDYNDMIGIGTGKTAVPRHILNQVDWASYTMATRKLLMAVFPRRTLATHSLTGKSSPAFMNKPAKLCLDQVKVNDIVMTVVDKCNVKESLVRSAITTKCADENKMFRMRQEKFEKRQKSSIDNSYINQDNFLQTD